jgi:hypothetical protein
VFSKANSYLSLVYVGKASCQAHRLFLLFMRGNKIGILQNEMKQNLVKTERFLTENFIKCPEIKLKYRMKFALLL